MAYLFLNQRELLKVPLQERHLLLLSFVIAITDDVVVLLLNFIQLDLKLDHLQPYQLMGWQIC